MLSRAERDIQYHDAIGQEYGNVVVTPRAYPNKLLFEPVNRLIRGGDAMLDVGCGTGHMIVRYGRHYKEVTGIDHSEKMIDAARKELGRLGVTNVQFKCLDIFSYLERENRTFDLVTCVGCLHHQERLDIPGIIAELAKRVIPGGLLVIADPIEVDPDSLPAEVHEWNRKSIATTIQYSKTVSEPEEAPIPVELLLDGLRDAGMTAKVVNRSWELLPRHIPPSLWDKFMIRTLHKRYGANGNVIVVAAVLNENGS